MLLLFHDRAAQQAVSRHDTLQKFFTRSRLDGQMPMQWLVPCATRLYIYMKSAVLRAFELYARIIRYIRSETLYTR